jgi:7-cyano-7-deazaguanine synthase
MTDCILFSGGVDSLIGWFKMGKPTAIYHQLGHRYQDLEMQAVLNLEDATPGLKTFINSDLGWMGFYEKLDAEIPGRNFQLAFNAALNGFQRIGIVCQLDERSIPDRSIEFFYNAEKMLQDLFGHRIVLDPVFPADDKTSMIEWFLSAPLGIERNHKIEILKTTVACYRPTEAAAFAFYDSQEEEEADAEVSKSRKIQCGACPACFRRAVAFCLNGIYERYASDVWTSAVAMEYAMKAKQGAYSEQRCQRILKAFEEAGISRVQE